MAIWSPETRMQRAMFCMDLNEVAQRVPEYYNKDGVLA